MNLRPIYLTRTHAIHYVTDYLWIIYMSSNGIIFSYVHNLFHCTIMYYLFHCSNFVSLYYFIYCLTIYYSHQKVILDQLLYRMGKGQKSFNFNILKQYFISTCCVHALRCTVYVQLNCVCPFTPPCHNETFFVLPSVGSPLDCPHSPHWENVYARATTRKRARSHFIHIRMRIIIFIKLIDSFFNK